VKVTRVVLVAVAAAAAIAAVPATSQAAMAQGTPVWPCHFSWCLPSDALGYVEASPTLNLRTAPCLNTNQCGIVGSLPYGDEVAIRCYERGDSVTGWGGTTNVWDLILNPNGDGFLGWASDAWIDTGGDTSTMVTQC
jgi:hypothetical protein